MHIYCFANPVTQERAGRPAGLYSCLVTRANLSTNSCLIRVTVPWTLDAANFLPCSMTFLQFSLTRCNTWIVRGEGPNEPYNILYIVSPPQLRNTNHFFPGFSYYNYIVYIFLSKVFRSDKDGNSRRLWNVRFLKLHPRLFFLNREFQGENFAIAITNNDCHDFSNDEE